MIILLLRRNIHHT